jgi:hypothetical protein
MHYVLTKHLIIIRFYDAYTLLVESILVHNVHREHGKLNKSFEPGAIFKQAIVIFTFIIR